MVKMYTTKACSIFAIYLLSTVTALKKPPRQCSGQSCPSPSRSLQPPITSRERNHQKPAMSHPSLTRKPSPTPAKHENDKGKGPKPGDFFQRFFRTFKQLQQLVKKRNMQAGMSSSLPKHDHKTAYPRPSPSLKSNKMDDDFKREARKLTDGIMDLILEDLGEKKPIMSAYIHAKPTPHPPITPQKDAERNNEERKRFMNVILNGFKNDPGFMHKLVVSDQIDLKNGTAVRLFVHDNLPRIARDYWRFVRWVVKQFESMPCGRDCKKIEQMVQFCKRQHHNCRNNEPSPSKQQNASERRFSIQPSPSPYMPDEKPCSARMKRCFFRDGCFRLNDSCVEKRDLFGEMGRSQNGVNPRPTPSMSRQPATVSHYPQHKKVIAGRRLNETMMGYAWEEAKKVNSTLHRNDLQMTSDKLRRGLAGYRDTRNDLEGRNDERDKETCSKLCGKRNATFCWAEMRCKPAGANCSLHNLRHVMNKTALWKREECNGTYFCPVLQECVMDKQSCNASRFATLPCDEECMKATGRKGKMAAPSDISIFRLKCQVNEKYCPEGVGCVGSRESCSGNKRLDVPLGAQPSAEKRFFCRLRDYICPRVFKKWIAMKPKCSMVINSDKESNSDNGRHSSRRPFSSGIHPTPHKSRTPQNTKFPPQRLSQRPSPRVSKRPSQVPPQRPYSRPASTRLHIRPSPTPTTGASLPFVTLSNAIELGSQFKMRRNEMITVTKKHCSSSMEFQMIIRGGIRRILNVPSVGSGNGLLLPGNMILQYFSKDPMFHGLCLLKYTIFKQQSGVRYSPPQVVPVASHSKSGYIGIVILPNFGTVEARLIGSHMIKIKEDEKNPTCFKLNDMIQFNKTQAKIESKIKPEFQSKIKGAIFEHYMARIAMINGATVHAAIVGYKGLSWRSGVWKFRDGRSKFKNFPPHADKVKPFILGTQTCVALFPAKDFSGKVFINVAGALTLGRQVTLGTRMVQVGVEVMPEPDAPELLASDCCLKPFPFQFSAANNRGINLGDILKSGKRFCGSVDRKGTPLVRNLGEYAKKKIGLAITRVSKCGKFGHWEFKKDNDTFKRIVLSGGKALCLLRKEHIRFVPSNYSKLWSVPQAQDCVWVEVKAWAPLSSNKSGQCSLTSDGKNLFSESMVKLSALRMGCDNVIGSMRKPDSCGRCGRIRLSNVNCPCDSVLGSGAVFDDCKRCSGGTTKRVFQKLDCAKVCYDNGTVSENVEDACGRCTKRRYASKYAKDCHGDCLFGNRRACRNKCGFCVGGNTSKLFNYGINDCGICVANASAPCRKSFSLPKQIEVNAGQLFRLKVKVIGYSIHSPIFCSLQKIGESASPLNIGQGYVDSPKKMAVFDPNVCQEDGSGNFQVMFKVSLQRAGRYNLTCRRGADRSSTAVLKGIVVVVSDQSSVQSIFPPAIDSCRSKTLILKGSGFKNSSEVTCQASCRKRCDFTTTGRYINRTAFECRIEFRKDIVDCEAQEINFHVLASSAVTTPRFSSSAPKVIIQCSYPKIVSGTYIARRRFLNFKLNKPTSFHASYWRQRPSCASFFDADTLRKLGKSRCFLTVRNIFVILRIDATLLSSAVGSILSVNVNREKLRCNGKEAFSVLRGSRIQALNVSIPAPSVRASISGSASIGTCETLRLNGRSSSGGGGYKLTFGWELREGSIVVFRESKRSWFNINGRVLTPHGNYTIKLCVRNVFGGHDCKVLALTVIDNSNSTLIVKMRGDQHKRLKARGNYRIMPFVKINQCGRNAKKAAQMSLIWEIQGKDGVVIKTSEGRSLNVKRGDLAPGKNYTLKCFARAKMESGEDVTGEAEITAEMEGSPIKARIRGGRRLTVGCNEMVVFDARPSSDPDETDETPRFFWGCSEKDGLPCFHVFRQLERLSFAEKDTISFVAGELLACNKSYVMTLEYSKGERKSNASVEVSLVPGEPAEVKLEQKKRGNRIILHGYIKTKSSVNASWSCVEKEGYGQMDMSDPSVARLLVSGTFAVRRRVSRARRTIMMIDTDYLEQGQSYLINLEVQNEDGTSNAQIVIVAPSPPALGSIAVEPSDGVALNTSFTVTADEGWEEEVRFEVGFTVKTKRGRVKDVILKTYSLENFIDGVQLPPGDREKNHSITLFVKAKNLDGLVTRITTNVRVLEPEDISESEINDMMSRSRQAIMEKNFDSAIRSIQVLAETTNDRQINQTGDKTVQENLAGQVLDIIDQTTDLDATRGSILSTLDSTTKPLKEEGLEISGLTRERIAAAVRVVISGVASSSSNSEKRRKRRSVENSGSQQTFTPKTKDEVDSTIAIFDNVIDENEQGTLQDGLKQNFTSTVPFLARSLCANTFTVEDFLVSKSNLSTIRSNRLSSFTFDTQNVNMSESSNGSQLILGSYLRQKYESWNCSQSGLLCTEMCIATILYHHHLFTGDFQGRISDIASTILIHPETHGIENPGTLTQPLKYSMLLKEVPDAQHTVECRVWDSADSNWTNNGCNTSYSAGHYVDCYCSVLGNVTVFKVAVPVITTLFPPTTTAETSSQSTHQSTMNGSTTPNVTAVAPTRSSQEQTTAPSGSQPHVEISFRFPVNYNDFSNRADDLKNAIIDMLSTKLGISRSRISNLTLKPGSIIVTFLLLNSSGYTGERDTNELKTQLTALASNGSLSLVFGGVTLTADAATLKFSQPSKPQPIPTPKPAKSKDVVVIVSVVIAVLILIAAAIAIWYCLFKRKKAKRLASDKMASSSMLFGDDIKLKECSSSPPDYMGIDNQKFDESPGHPKMLEESSTDSQPLQRAVTPVGSKPNSAEKSRREGPGEVVSVGIGSSTSLKRDMFTS